jgi:hypothetical protein
MNEIWQVARAALTEAQTTGNTLTGGEKTEIFRATIF